VVCVGIPVFMGSRYAWEDFHKRRGWSWCGGCALICGREFESCRFKPGKNGLGGSNEKMLYLHLISS